VNSVNSLIRLSTLIVPPCCWVTMMGFHQGTPVVPRRFLPTHAAMFGNRLQMPVTRSGRILGRLARHATRTRWHNCIGRWKRVIGHALRSQTNERQAAEVAIAVDVLNRMLELGRPSYLRIP
jgi:hypothetical protein